MVRDAQDALLTMRDSLRYGRPPPNLLPYNASPFSNRGTSPANPAAWRMNMLFSGGARSTSPRPISRTVRNSVDSFENNRFNELVASPIAMVSKRRQR